MWSSRTLYRRQKRLNNNLYSFDNTFQYQATREIVREVEERNELINEICVDVDENNIPESNDSSSRDNNEEWVDQSPSENNLDQGETYEIPSFASRNFTKHEIATALIILKSRHKLTTKAISDICRLLRQFNVPNAPRSFNAVKRTVENQTTDQLKTELLHICPSCNNVYKGMCSNPTCQSNPSSEISPVFLKFPIKTQIESVLTSEQNFSLRPFSSIDQSDCIIGIEHGDWYRSLASNEDQSNFITLLLNVDGIAMSESSDNSLWIFTLIINEIDRSQRYELHNCIFGGVWPGPKKPTRGQMHAMVKSIINELKVLENEHVYLVKGLENKMVPLKVFLIGSECDKPAQAIVQNIAEPIAKYGCGKCLISGVTVPSRDGASHHLRVFPLPTRSHEEPELRSNRSYDEVMKLTHPTDDQRKGYLGECALRALKYFDVGRSFLTDSLHNLYGGAMKKLLTLWFGDDYKRSEWSSFNKIAVISEKLMQYRYPSTTSRTPRSLTQYHRYKANEFRLVSLFGAPVFRRYLDPLYYKNYLLLVFAFHLAESRAIHKEDIDDIDFLLNTFLHEYPLLYTNRHNQQVIHSLRHVSQSVRDYGQLSNYSTFNFEYVLGMLRSTVHSTKHQANEIANTMNLLRLAIQHTLSDEFSSILKQTLDQIQATKKFDDGLTSAVRVKSKVVKLGLRQIIEENQYRQLQEMFQCGNVRLFKTIFLDGTRFTTRDFARGKKNDDSCILYKWKTKANVDFIDRIVQVDQKIFFKIRRVAIKENLSCIWENRKFHCDNITIGKLNNEESALFIHADDMIEKLVYYEETTNSFFFFRFPTLLESS